MPDGKSEQGLEEERVEGVENPWVEEGEEEHLWEVEENPRPAAAAEAGREWATEEGGEGDRRGEEGAGAAAPFSPPEYAGRWAVAGWAPAPWAGGRWELGAGGGAGTAAPPRVWPWGIPCRQARTRARPNRKIRQILRPPRRLVFLC